LEYALTDDPLALLRGNITTDLHHYVNPGFDFRNNIDGFLSAIKPKPRPATQRPTSPDSRWPCQDPRVRGVFLDFDRRFIEIFKDIDVAEPQRKDIQLEAKCLVMPGESFDDRVMCFLNHPTFDHVPSKRCYGSTLDEGDRCVKALSKAFGGLQGSSISLFGGTLQAFTDLVRYIPRRRHSNPSPTS
jgi:hypothetical protein